MLASIEDPRRTCDGEHDAKRDDAVIHVVGCGGQSRGEDEEDGGDNGPEDADLRRRF